MREERDAALAMDAATFRKLGHRLVDHVAEFLESLPRRPVTHDQSPPGVRAVEFAFARFSAMIRIRACWARSADAAMAWVTPLEDLTSGI